MAAMNRFIEPAYRGAPARHWRLLFGKYKGKTLSVIPGWYLHFLLKQPRLDPALRAAMYKHAMKVTGSTPSNRVRKERKNA